MHTGVDFGAPSGAPIRAAAGGIVLLSAYNRGYGNCVILYHGGGVSTLYGHCSERLVREGQSVRSGQLIARVGATGMATGPHLHFEVRRNGVPVPPY
jgi:murein DD-endopeptidase MepM/ murein hydrolase activator NlpD